MDKKEGLLKIFYAFDDKLKENKPKEEETMRKDFYIFRHGETDYNKVKRWQGCGIDAELNENGMRQAEQLIEKLADKNLQIIYSSGLKRAIKTAEIVAAELGVEVKIIKDLHEGNLGQTEGMLKTEVAEKYPEIYNLWYDDEKDYLDITFPGGETKRQIFNRMYKVLESLLLTKETSIGIASHGAAIRYLLLGLGYRTGRMENCALFHLIYDDGQWQVEA